mgnify:CR=1 FL=1
MKNLQLFLEQAKIKKAELDSSQSEFEKTQAQLAGDSGSDTLDSPEGRDFTISARERYLNSTKERRERKEKERIEREKEKIAAEKAAEKEAEKQELRDIRDDIKTQKQELKKALATEVYDPEMGTVRGPRASRSTADRRKPGVKPRVAATGGGKSKPVDYKPQGEKPNRSRTISQRTQQPTKERGSTEVKQSYAEKIKADRRAAAKARAAARASGGKVKSTTTSSKDAEKKADQLLKTKTAEPKKIEPAKPRKKYAHADGGGMTRKERDATRNKATGQSRKDAKSQMRAEFEKTHGRKPNKKESIQMTAKAHAAAKALS